MASPVASPVPSWPGWADGPQSRIPAPFAGLLFCRHSYATSNSKHLQGGLRHVLYPAPIYVPCTRRLRYRHRAGSTALLHHLGDRNRLGAWNSESTADHRLGAALAAPHRQSLAALGCSVSCQAGARLRIAEASDEVLPWLSE